jgi:DNA excision repair protein ERCC-5
MGVKDLWQLLAPCGRRVSIETLAGKTLAIDASIWITQFVKAMRDESGKMIKNAHIIGTLRRVLKLMYNHIKPVFVFDGATPTLKIATVARRRRLREQQEVNLKKSAERILMARLKQHAIESHQKKVAQGAAVSKDAKINENSRYAEGFNPRPTTGLESEEEGGEEEEEDGEVVLPIYRPAAILEGNGEEGVEWETGFSNLKNKRLKTLSDDDSSSAGDDDDEKYDMPELFTDYMTSTSTSTNTGGTDTSAGGGAGSEGGEQGVDINVLAALPPHMRKSMIEQARCVSKYDKNTVYTFYLPPCTATVTTFACSCLDDCGCKLSFLMVFYFLNLLVGAFLTSRHILSRLQLTTSATNIASLCLISS